MSGSSARVAVAVMAKVPTAGEVKTRLCPPLTPVQAATLARCFLQDRVEQLGALEAADPLVAFAPPEGEAEMRELLPNAVRLVPQSGADLGARLDRLLSDLLADGYPGAIAVDADSPTLPTAFLGRACAHLLDETADVVVGPCEDGGYYLLGLRRPAPALFREMPWSTPAVLDETLARARRLGLRVALLPAWFDVDREEDLARLRAGGPPAGSPAGPPFSPRRTLAFLEALAASRAGTAVTLRPADADERRPSAPEGRRGLAEVPWQTRSTRIVYQNPWIRVDEDRVELPDGRSTIYGVVRCGECVGVLPFLDPDTVVLIRQYRYVARGVFWEMPTGGVHPGESLEVAAQRELGEEIGHRAGRLIPLVSYHTSKSVVDETAHLFAAEALAPVSTPPDATEFIEVRPVPFAEALRMVEQGEIKDSMTVIAVLHAARRRGR
ncbi:MAG TPA: TIGR04282 family arsenosugar biosynthesis glycosyltransferase [Methylomirabilota bacterium]|nr:TIGR04282 family arsenosugar biosynthesis glycosyltransferase [Methylomirabilota bacterium]